MNVTEPTPALTPGCRCSWLVRGERVYGTFLRIDHDDPAVALCVEYRRGWHVVYTVRDDLRREEDTERGYAYQ